jgi:hypothetical protein
MATGNSLDAAALLARASKVTKEWPGHPDWSYVSTEGGTLILAAHELSEAEQTVIHFALPAGKYKFSGKGLLRKECEFPASLSLSEGGQAFFSKTFQRANAADLMETFEIKSAAGSEVVLEFKMAPEAKNAYSGTLRISDFSLEKTG